MARVEKTVFISYRRTDVYTALAVYENLKNQGYDVFFDYRSISSGDFEQIISSNIKARAHFILILTPTALDRCNEPGDWLRREIEVAIDEKRNIVPLLFNGFRFGDPSVSKVLTGKLENLSRYNGLNVHADYFDEAMHRLRTQYLNKPLDTVLHPVSTEVQKVVRAEQVAADQALEQIENVKELVKQADDKPVPLEEPDPLPELTASEPAVETPASKEADSHIDIPQSLPEQKKSAPNFNYRLIGGILLLALIIWGAANTFQNTPTPPADPTRTSQVAATQTRPSLSTRTPSPSETSAPITPTLGIRSPMTGKDGMTLLYVPAGNFKMGEVDFSRNVSVEAFWLDQTEITNVMYDKCVQDGACNQPVSINSFTHDAYFGNSQFYNYPVIFVTWNDAATYCEWAGRRLPTEAEWEKAAGWNDSMKQKYLWPWGDSIDGTRANFCDKNCQYDWADRSIDDGFADTAPVGNYPDGASPNGALDMAGNVHEWVNDQQLPDYRVIRGGSWSDHSGQVQTSWVAGADPSAGSYNIGFRCAMSATP